MTARSRVSWAGAVDESSTQAVFSVVRGIFCLPGQSDGVFRFSSYWYGAEPKASQDMFRRINEGYVRRRAQGSAERLLYAHDKNHAMCRAMCYETHADLGGSSSCSSRARGRLSSEVCAVECATILLAPLAHTLA